MMALLIDELKQSFEMAYNDVLFEMDMQRKMPHLPVEGIRRRVFGCSVKGDY